MLKKLISNITIRKRLFTILITLLLPTMFLLIELVNQLKARTDIFQSETYGIRYQIPLSKTLTSFQDYKIALLLHSDPQQIASLKSEIEKNLNDLLQIDHSLEGKLLLTKKDLEAKNLTFSTIEELAAKWENLRELKNYDKAKLDDFKTDIINLNKYICDTSKLILDASLDTYYLMDATSFSIPNTLDEIINTTESFINVLNNNGNIFPADELYKIDSTQYILSDMGISKISNSIETAIRENITSDVIIEDLPVTLSSDISKVKAHETKLLEALEKLKNNQSITGQEFYKYTEEIHSEMETLLTTSFEYLDKIITTRLKKSKMKQNIIISIFMTSLSLALILSLSISGSIINPITNLKTHLETLSNGITNFKVEVDNGKSEISSLLLATSNLKNSLEEAFLISQMVLNMPINTLSIDPHNNFTVRYSNKVSLITLEKIAESAQIDKDILGKPFNLFGENAEQLKSIMSDPKNLPYASKIKFGNEVIKILISSIKNNEHEYVGAMLTFEIITAKEQLADEFERDIKSIVHMVASAVTELSLTAEEVTSTIQKNTQMSSDAEEAAIKTTNNVHSVATATEHLSASVNEISDQLQKTNLLVQDSSAKAVKADALANELKQATTRVNEVIDLISNISGQINLLALNATIESARAGEAGRGFAVVAGEVKNLANQTDKSVSEVLTVITDMKLSSDAITASLIDIKSSISDISVASSGVASAVEEQSVTTSEISSNMQNAASLTQIVSGNLGNVSSNSKSTMLSAEQMVDATKELSQQAEMLNLQVDNFLTKIRAI
jgi:methyl-accepting chemotaxis protein